MEITDFHRRNIHNYRSNIKNFFENKVNVGGAFDWSITAQGYRYWSDISRKNYRPEQEKAVADYLLAAGFSDLVPARYHPKVDEDLLWD